MSPIVTLRFDARELAALRAAVRAEPVGAGGVRDLGRAAVAAQFLWRERAGSLSRVP